MSETVRAEPLRDKRHIDKAIYLNVDEWFYESTIHHYCPTDELRLIVQQKIDQKYVIWQMHRDGVWTHVFPDLEHRTSKPLPAYGWKIHVSATNLNCQQILEKVSEYALANHVQFKFANDTETLRLMTSKRWSRGGSGKFITIYPTSDQEFKDLIEAFYKILHNYEGSFILSDKRYKDCRCLYYRYGSILPPKKLDIFGERREVLTSPDGIEYYDRRQPYFELPDWVVDPFPDEAPEAGDMTLNSGRYHIKSALQFSNTGGVYLAIDGVSQREVIIKEARPSVELAIDGQDAISRLEQEAKILETLSGSGIVPQIYNTFWDWENFYIVEEYFKAADLRQVMLTNSPFLKVYPNLEDSGKFYTIYKSIFTSLLEAVDGLHSRGVIIGDLSPSNILVNESDMTVRIIDLEGAYRPELDNAQDITTPGFRAKSKVRQHQSNFTDDIFAVGASMLYAMFPIVAMSYIRSDLYTTVLPTMIADIGWANTPVADIIKKLTDNTINCRQAIGLFEAEATIGRPFETQDTGRKMPALSDLRREIARFIVSNCRLDTDRTLFPIDPFGAESNPSGFAFGSTGIVYALNRCGIDIPPSVMARYQSEIDLPVPEMAPGLLIGTAGMAWALMLCKEEKIARAYIESANDSHLNRDHHSLYYGMAGIGLANLAIYLSLGDKVYLDSAISLAETLDETAIECERGLHWEHNGKIDIGFGYGQSGVALFFLRLSQLLGDPRWRARGKMALEYDLSYAFEIEPGVVSFGESPDEVRTLEQYIEQGTGGIAKVAIRYGLWDRVELLLADLYRKYSVFSGLIYGISGFIDVFTDAYIYSKDNKYLRMSERPIQGLFDLYLFENESGYAAPGDNLFRISCDYATGLAGIMLSLNRRDRLHYDDFCLDSLDNIGANSC